MWFHYTIVQKKRLREYSKSLCSSLILALSQMFIRKVRLKSQMILLRVRYISVGYIDIYLE